MYFASDSAVGVIQDIAGNAYHRRQDEHLFKSIFGIAEPKPVREPGTEQL